MNLLMEKNLSFDIEKVKISRHAVIRTMRRYGFKDFNESQNFCLNLLNDFTFVKKSFGNKGELTFTFQNKNTKFCLNKSLDYMTTVLGDNDDYSKTKIITVLTKFSKNRILSYLKYIKLDEIIIDEKMKGFKKIVSQIYNDKGENVYIVRPVQWEYGIINVQFLDILDNEVGRRLVSNVNGNILNTRN